MNNLRYHNVRKLREKICIGKDHAVTINFRTGKFEIQKT